MFRRNFVTAVTALASCVLVPIVRPSKKELLEVKISNGYVELNGSPADVTEFATKYQTNLWPEWQTHPIDDGRRNFAIAEKEMSKGNCKVAYNCKQTMTAFEKTLSEWNKPFVIV